MEKPLTFPYHQVKIKGFPMADIDNQEEPSVRIGQLHFATHRSTGKRDRLDTAAENALEKSGDSPFRFPG